MNICKYCKYYDFYFEEDGQKTRICLKKNIKIPDQNLGCCHFICEDRYKIKNNFPIYHQDESFFEK